MKCVSLVYIRHKGQFSLGRNKNLHDILAKVYIFFMHDTSFVLGGLRSGLNFFTLSNFTGLFPEELKKLSF